MFNTFFANIDDLRDCNLVVDALLVRAVKSAKLDSDQVFTIDVLRDQHVTQRAVRLLKSSLTAQLNQHDALLLRYINNSTSTTIDLVADVKLSYKEALYIARAFVALQCATLASNKVSITLNLESKLLSELIKISFENDDFLAQEE